MVNTVLGPVDAAELGTTYIHEHLYVKPNELPAFYPYTLDDVDRGVEEIESFMAAGGSTIVELSPLNFGRNTEALKVMATRTGCHILCVTGLHKEEHLPTWFDKLSDDEIAGVVADEIEDGIGTHRIKPAAVKVGTSLNTITDRERRAIKICTRVAVEHHMPMITHCDKGTMALEQLALVEAEGMDPSHVCLSHVDLTLNAAYIAAICNTGAYVSLDHVGRDLDGRDHERASMIKELVEIGVGDRLCLAGDMGKKEYWPAYGGKPGLACILTDLKKELTACIGEEAFDAMVRANPQRLLNWA